MISTIFPPILQTVWRSGDLALQLFDSGELISRGPHITLDAGMFGVEFQLAANSPITDPNLVVAVAQITASEGQIILTESPVKAGQIAQEFAGMYGGVRMTLILDRAAHDIEFRVISAGVMPLTMRGFKIVPRPGRIWFVDELGYNHDHWQHHPDRSSTALKPTLLTGPGITLDLGEYRAGIKLIAPPGMISGEIARIGAACPTGVITLMQPVTAEETLAAFGIPEAKLRFRLSDTHAHVRFRIQTLVPDVTVEWVRLATAEDSVWQHYFNLGGRHSPLGRPISAFTPDEPSRAFVLGSVRHFEHGAIYWTIDHGPCEVYGAIAEQFTERGGTGGVGFPISRPRITRHSDGTQTVSQQFLRDTTTILTVPNP